MLSSWHTAPAISRMACSFSLSFEHLHSIFASAGPVLLMDNIQGPDQRQFIFGVSGNSHKLVVEIINTFTGEEWEKMKLNEYIYCFPESGMIDCNTYLIRGRSAMVIDTGSARNLPALIDDIQKDGIGPEEIQIIANTHLHLDHIWANNEFKAWCGGRIEFDPLQQLYYQTSAHDAARYFGVEPADSQCDGSLHRPVDLGDIQIEVFHTPGHSPDSICFFCPACKAMVTGDVTFCRNTGRVDLPGGDVQLLKQSIDMISEMDIELLLPGHAKTIEGKNRVEENFAWIRQAIFPLL